VTAAVDKDTFFEQLQWLVLKFQINFDNNSLFCPSLKMFASLSLKKTRFFNKTVIINLQ
jgi:hypothetical protein